MLESDIRKFQEAMAGLSAVKDEIAKATFELYKAYQKAGFSRWQALELAKNFTRSGVNDD